MWCWLSACVDSAAGALADCRMPYDIGAPELSWWLPQIEDRGTAILIDGVIRPPSWPPAGPLRLAADGAIVAGVDYLEQNQRIVVRGMLPARMFDEDVVLRVVNADTGLPVRAWDHFALQRPGANPHLPLPPAKLTNRAVWLGPRVFDRWGYALKRKYDEAVARHIGKPRRVLDWGCGAGRLARYLVGECDYTGIDIDAEAIDWCRANIPNGRFLLQALEARTPFADDSFDAVIGISIFTHLREEDQLAWLKELARITRPGGIVAVSVCGATSLFNAVNPPWAEEVLRERGFVDTGVEATLQGVTTDDEYYRNVYHTPGYIRERWGQDFEVLEILPAFVANMQDLVLLRPRA